eukprot:CAMPEP_0201575448 /NCGR_PEP_ID=MMETSP0190_2-20130828/20659_1 /ASSEMBLY_ACC=CAM_ASM_000263 /TAXON_ID=37353 /ORGANISM="Rosalina sp." /LENGTH=270 /DNA_ID=CAMNT_0048005095 /DNA_START=249 /DNA_END=1062 /DNA_ORIENTATION=+
MIHCIILFALISINNGDIGEGIVQFDKYVLVGNKELGLDDHINSYDAANAYCQNNYGTTLASISKDDSDDLSALRAAIESVNSPQFDEHVFIGARYDSTPTESKWKWADGTDAPFSDETYFTGYFNGPPSVRGCVFAYANFQHPLPIEFNNGACNNPAGFFLCAKSPGCLSGATEDKCGDGASCQSDGTCVCNPGYTGDGTSCTPSTSFYLDQMVDVISFHQNQNVYQVKMVEAIFQHMVDIKYMMNHVYIVMDNVQAIMEMYVNQEIGY